MSVPEVITDREALDAVVKSALEEPRYAIDTEFHRERTYFPQVALVQLAWGDQVALIDPLAISLEPFAQLLDGPGQCVFHAGVQDLEVLDLACGTVPTQIFDTQIAAGFLGLSSGSLASLLDRYMGLSMTKGDRLTDWLQRPLTEAQLRYAAGDVDNLLELTDILSEELVQRGRLDWANDESQLLLDKPRSGRVPEEAVKRIKEARSLRGKSLKVATAVAAWRERRAAQLDVPVRQVLSDIAVIGVAQKRPRQPKACLQSEASIGVISAMARMTNFSTQSKPDSTPPTPNPRPPNPKTCRAPPPGGLVGNSLDFPAGPRPCARSRIAGDPF